MSRKTRPIVFRKLGIEADQETAHELQLARKATVTAAMRRIEQLREQPGTKRSLAWQRMVRDVLKTQRDELVRLRDAGSISDHVRHAVRRDLDLEDQRLDLTCDRTAARRAAHAHVSPVAPDDTFVSTGPTRRRKYEAQAWRLVRRLARTSGLKSAGQLSPHSLRHTFATSLDDAGVPLQDIQDAIGHADPRTTRRHMATRQHLDRHTT